MKIYFNRRLIITALAVATLLSMSFAASAQDPPLAGEHTSAQVKKTTTTRRRRTRRRRTTTTKTTTVTTTPTVVVVPSGTHMKVRLNETLSSKESRVGDRFT